MPKVSGIDFSSFNDLKDKVTVRMDDGSEVELPLITMRYATEGFVFLQRNDTLNRRFAVKQAKLRLKSDALTALNKSVDTTSDTFKENAEENFSVLEDTFKSIDMLQKELGELCVESNKLCVEIREYLKPHLEGTTVIANLEKADDIYTVKVLEFMLYGTDALKSEEAEGKEENPSTTASPSN